MKMNEKTKDGKQRESEIDESEWRTEKRWSNAFTILATPALKYVEIWMYFLK